MSYVIKYFHNVRFNQQKKDILKRIILLLFEAQEHRPFFHVEGTKLPLCWNRPSDLNIDCIKYQWWHHLLSQNQKPEQSSSIENIGLYSARCNQHI